MEYVAERVSSSCIKYICSTLLSTERKKNVEEINKIIFDRNSKNSTNLDDTELKVKYHFQLNVLEFSKINILLLFSLY